MPSLEDVPRRVGLLGAGGQAREIRSYLPPATQVFHAVESRFIDAGDEEIVDLAAPAQLDLETPVVAAVGAPGLRRRLVQIWPGQSYVSVVSATAYVSSSVAMGAGCVVSPQAALSIGVRLGDHCQLNLGATVSHDSRLGDHVTLAPGAHVAGCVVLGNGVFVGIGAAVSARVHVADGVVVGAGATVLHDVTTPNAVVVGTPAKVVSVGKEWLREF